MPKFLFPFAIYFSQFYLYPILIALALITNFIYSSQALLFFFIKVIIFFIFYIFIVIVLVFKIYELER